MANGRNDGVMADEEEDRERSADFVAMKAAALVAAGDETPTNAIKMAAEYLLKSREADGDVTGTLEVENTFPEPSITIPDEQIRRVADGLLEAARKALEDD